MLADPRPAPVVLLEQPKNMGNIGACIRVAAAADAAAVLTTGENDPWYPDAVRGAAGLHFALPVAAIEALPASDRPLLAIDPEGEELRPGAAAAARRARLRHRAPRASATSCSSAPTPAIAIPMRAGVSSLNLATSVAVVALRAGGLAPTDETSMHVQAAG